MRVNPFDKINVSMPDFLGRMDDKSVSEKWDTLTDEHKNELFETVSKIVSDNIKISGEDWSRTHPQHLKCNSDKYYADLTNRMCAMLSRLSFQKGMPQDALIEMSMSVAAYLEDVVSGLGVWDSIRTLYRKTYGSWLPFYDTEHEDYLLDNVNEEDVKFLVWQAMCRCGQPDEIVFSPYSDAVKRISELIYPIIEEEFETAPEAKRVYDFIVRSLSSGDYYKVRDIAQWIVVGNKLTSSPNEFVRLADEAAAIKDVLPAITGSQALYHACSNVAWKRHCGPMGCPSARYVAELSRVFGFGDAARKLDDLKFIPGGVFKVKNVGSKTVEVEDACGDVFVIEKSSFGKGMRFKDIRGFILSMAKYGDLWQQNGVASGMPTDPFVDDVRLPVSYPTSKAKALWEDIVARNGGRRIFYCRDYAGVANLMGIPYNEFNNDSEEQVSNIVMMISEEEGLLINVDSWS